MEERGGGRAHGMVQLPRDCGLCKRRSRGCGPAVAEQFINRSIWSCRPQVASSGTLGVGTNCGSATDKITVCKSRGYGEEKRCEDTCNILLLSG